MDRARDGGVALGHFTHRVLVRCPRCEDRAVVQLDEDAEPRLTCTHCGFNRRGDGSSRTLHRGALDPHFDLPLWLQAPCCGEVLWAYNGEHRAFLERFVSASIRERSPRAETADRNRLLASRLPRWITSKKNRDEVLRTLRELEELAR
ncbi:MAG: TFIIB-type zinc ribbon-containing protein [Gemmatimonadota bacterium]